MKRLALSLCADAKAWEAESAAFADNQGDGTLGAFSEDSDEKVRGLVLKRFTDWNRPFADRALAERLIAVDDRHSAAAREEEVAGALRRSACAP